MIKAIHNMYCFDRKSYVAAKLDLNFSGRTLRRKQTRQFHFDPIPRQLPAANIQHLISFLWLQIFEQVRGFFSHIAVEFQAAQKHYIFADQNIPGLF